MNTEIITEKFANKYSNKQPNWGFNGLGYIVYKRTYARLKEDGKTEEWHDTIRRCINGAQKIGANYTQEEAETTALRILYIPGFGGGTFKD